MKIIFRTATVLFNVNILFSCHSGNFNVGKQDSIGFFCRWYPQITQSRFPFPFLPQVCLFTSEFKNKLIHVKGTKFLLKEVWVCLFCLFLFTVMFSWRTTSASILSKAYNFFIFFFYQAMLFERMFCVLDVGDNQYCTGRVQKAAVWVLHLFCPSSMVLRQLLNCRHVKKNPLNCMDYKYIYK